jgi:hypothetical protein
MSKPLHDNTPSSHSAVPEHDPSFPARTEKSETEVLRRYNNELSLWLFCRRAACYRLRACKGEPRQCIGRYEALIPEDVVEAAKALHADEDAGGLPGEITMDHDEAMAVLTDWNNRVAHARQP